MINSRSEISINSALAKHVNRFTTDEQTYSPTTIAQGLAKINSSHSGLKGLGIFAFNSAHSGNTCPWSAPFKPDPHTGYANNLHLGTTRIWNADGSINEERWKQFEDYISIGQNNNEKIVTLSTLNAYLKKCFESDPEDPYTGRNALSLFSNKTIQQTAATGAWGEVFDRLCCGWVANKQNGNLEPYITLAVIREFFEDSNKAFLKAETNELPVAKPQAQSVPGLK